MSMHQLDRDALDRAFAVAAHRAESGDLPFVVLGVANAAGTIRVDATTAPAAERRVGTGAICLLASITKPIVGTAALRLVEQGRLSLTAPLADWLPELRTGDERERITAWHVLTHTTGMDDPDIEALIRQGICREELLERTLSRPLAAPVGSRFRYMTFTFELLALAMERAAGQPLPDLLRRLIFEPLGMTDTAFDPRPERAARVAPMTVGQWEGMRLITTLEPAVASGLRDTYTALRLAGGGIWSTAADLLRFGRAMLRQGELDGERILGPAMVRLATREVTVNGLGRAENRLDDEHYALGWAKPGDASPASARAFGHGGASGTRLWIDPEHDLVVAYLSGSWEMPSAIIDETVTAIYAATR